MDYEFLEDKDLLSGFFRSQFFVVNKNLRMSAQRIPRFEETAGMFCRTMPIRV